MESDAVSVERLIPAPAEAIFALLADPAQHPAIDGSGSVREAKPSSSKLALGSTFGMKMRMGIPYSTSNEVVEFEPNRRIAWAPRLAGPLAPLAPAGRRWRYELEPAEGGTRVRETWDISRDRLKGLFRRGRLPDRVRADMGATLERIEKLLT
ncbi:MAG TPA: SRPBCC family protein [Acidimicrobiales bacterium]|nr:SRPBCC family protein [Acidimicrobiales bacterium]